VDKQDKTPNFNSAAITPPVVDQTQREKPQSPNKTETVSGNSQLWAYFIITLTSITIA
jgi:hypothetical protein